MGLQLRKWKLGDLEVGGDENCVGRSAVVALVWVGWIEGRKEDLGV